MSHIAIFDEKDFAIETGNSRDVYAKHCLYFSWAQGDIYGPHDWSVGGREVGEDYRPEYIELGEPGTYDEIYLTADPTVYWRHGAPNSWRSRADGRSDVFAYTDSRYSVPDYRSEHILQNDALKLNALVAMFGRDFDNPPSEQYPSHVLNVGLSRLLTVPAFATHLYLGMHDGYEWSTNSNDGDVPMTVTYTLAKRK